MNKNYRTQVENVLNSTLSLSKYKWPNSIYDFKNRGVAGVAVSDMVTMCAVSGQDVECRRGGIIQFTK